MMVIMASAKRMTQNTVPKIIGVTGATGFIGGAICYELKKRGYYVVGIDLVKRKHLMPYIDTYFQQDFENIPAFHSPEWRECDAIVHCAGTSLVGPSVKYPLTYYSNNVAKTIKLLDWCATNHKHFLFSSSASVYKTSASPLRESDLKDPLSPYAKSKWMVEQVVEDFSKAYDLKATIFRYFNACGAIDNIHGQSPGAEHIFPQLLERKETFTLYGEDFDTPDGTCIRDYVHIKDIADAHVKAIDKKCYGVYNLGSGIGYSNREVIDAVGLQQWIVSNRRLGDTDCLIADNTLAKNILEWVPLNTLSEIVQDLKTWYNSDTFSGLKDQPAI